MRATKPMQQKPRKKLPIKRALVLFLGLFLILGMLPTQALATAKVKIDTSESVNEQVKAIIGVTQDVSQDKAGQPSSAAHEDAAQNDAIQADLNQKLQAQGGITALTVSVGSEQDLRNAIANASNGVLTTITLVQDIALATNTLEIPADKVIALTGNYKIIGPDKLTTISNHGTLTIDGITVTHASKDTETFFGVGNTGNLTLKSGAITGNSFYNVINGSAGKSTLPYIHFENILASFTMTGGEIFDVYSPLPSRAGVYNNASFTMTGGTITRCSVGVFNDRKFVMRGGTISNNINKTAEGVGIVGCGGGIQNRYDAEFTMYGGTITGNSALCGGGIFSFSNFDGWHRPTKTVLLGGTISNNTASSDRIGWGGGVACLIDSGNIYTSPPDYINLTVGPKVKFSGNRAPVLRMLKSSDKANFATYKENIKSKNWSIGLPYGFNNYDINYVVGKAYTAPPTIVTQPRAETIYYQKQKGSALRVKAATYDGGKLTYQWYYNAKNSKSKAKAIKGATKSSYTPSSKNASVYYYFCKVTNNKAGASPSKRSVYSKVVVVRTAPDFQRKTVNVIPYYKKTFRFDIKNASKKVGANLIIYPNNNQRNQRFIFTRDAYGYYKIRDVNSGLYLSISGSKVRSNASVIQAKNRNSKAQKFKVAQYANGNYTLRSALSPNYVLELKRSSYKSGNTVVLYKFNAKDKTQRFTIRTWRR